jgi:Na+/H+ antiporter NhaD/arsenite permease-like protein
LTTALLLGSLLSSVKQAPTRFLKVSYINIVVAANAGGVFSPFGDITSFMIWQKGYIHTFEFLHLFLPSLIAFLVPATIMSFSIPAEKTIPTSEKNITPAYGAYWILGLFILTIFTTLLSHHYLNLPSSVGMMIGLSYLQFTAFYIQRRSLIDHTIKPFNTFKMIASVKWDTLLFFYGMILCIGGLATLGYLALLTTHLYEHAWFGLTLSSSHWIANSAVGLISAIIDNIPMVYAVLTMNPHLINIQWQLLALTSGIGGSLLSIGSAAGLALMGESKHYTFFSHLKWSWCILLGYISAIAVHFLLT